MQDLIGLDFETYSAIDLRKHGLDNYVNDSTFQPLIAAVTDGTDSVVLDFTSDDQEKMLDELMHLIKDKTIVAHNAGFERAVLNSMGIYLPADRFIDSAVLARAYGAGGSLEAAAAQILGKDKIEAGKNLILLFSIPGQYQEGSNKDFDPRIIEDHHYSWQEFGHYCKVDAELCLAIAQHVLPLISEKELAYAAVTLDMNEIGWHVDRDLVDEMHNRYLLNVETIVDDFRKRCNAHDLNLSSHPQLMAWCKERGVRATSFDETHVASLLKAVRKKMSTLKRGDEAKLDQLQDVESLLMAKQAMGGSSLKKLATILDTVGSDSRLHDQYLHIGAGATYRTTGRGVQMQNLKRLNGAGDDMAELYIPANVWTNEKLASNLRQVFTATHPHGRLIVGDFASVESRGLAWQANEEWKLNAYFNGEDLYRVQAGRIFGKDHVTVTKEERQIGKVGELACGYGAGPGAVKEFAAKMGVELSEGESTKLVKDWRDANPEIVSYWYELDDAMHKALRNPGTVQHARLLHGWVQIETIDAPVSLIQQVGATDSLQVSMRLDGQAEPLFTRYIHGAAEVGRNIQYWKPSERKTGDLWTDRFTDPKTKHTRLYTVYGGKLAGLLTQSLCRELFFESLLHVSENVKHHPNVELVGQFHDEIVLDWAPHTTGPDLGRSIEGLRSAMTVTSLPQFPLAAEIKSDFRYTK